MINDAAEGPGVLRFILVLFTAAVLLVSASDSQPPDTPAYAGSLQSEIGPRIVNASAGDLTARLEPVDVALDPGHSSGDVGASAGGLREFELTLDVAQRVRARLLAAGRSVRLTREDSSRVAPFVPSEPTSATQTEQEA